MNLITLFKLKTFKPERYVASKTKANAISCYVDLETLDFKPWNRLKLSSWNGIDSFLCFSNKNPILVDSNFVSLVIIRFHKRTILDHIKMHQSHHTRVHKRKRHLTYLNWTLVWDICQRQLNLSLGMKSHLSLNNAIQIHCL